ncbi:MAG: UDP-N-acetylmuramyl pentapeptide phosphotransferase/UDP-N-acetylglucosamine-1-phosphate transferase [uncultured bacterium (gcode 4)]|uniref:UDP-N-acetylmuramyl pentapeptide phosphotransferase/UDP-N-acetylglucosamine-1-phosphate transferase n=1 Tax=uncultured bacterium (gcode 4) TaxID=1234023 RepID=K2G5Y2_9BACT|nr:MAG: UDP-N-acetylmuramyl pentapeptide phosphotransferase/UDP-N-acetylglucosamine-1-phosphate transferase [uncultured bacterium (gcode 4)]
MISDLLPVWIRMLFLFWASLITTATIIFFFKRLFKSIWFMDHPERYPHEWNRAPVPYWLGIVLFINFLIQSLLFLDIWYKKLIIILILGAIVTIVSFVDDLETIDIVKFKVHPLFRLIMQIWIWAIIWITSIKIWYISGIFGWIIRLDSYFLQWWDFRVYIIPLFFTIVWYVLVFNSINWSDVIPWLTSWLVEISLLILLVLTIRLYLTDISEVAKENSDFVLLLLSILLPSILVFWLFDIRKKFLIWDSWTMFLAFMIATLAIISWGKVATAATVLWMYIIDSFYVILVRLYNKKNPLKWDTIHHLHFRLGKLWFSQNFIRNLVYSLSFLFWIGAIFLDRTWKIIIFCILMVIVFFVTKILSLKSNGKA